MEYKLNKTNYRDFDVFEENKLAARAYFIPYSKKTDLDAAELRHERTGSDLVEVLSGEWDFKYYSDISQLPDALNINTVEFDKVHVPSTWQRTGYEPPVYLNCPYPFETPVPTLPEHMSAGVYHKSFEVSNSDNIHIISFLGVVPCVDLYVNGMYVGYSEGAHNTAEFDISEFIYEGTNELVAVVYKWSTGTYLECQDMFRENGIFRDVLLYRLPSTYINDYYIHPRKIDGAWSADVEVTLEGKLSGCEVGFSLEKDGNVIAADLVKAEHLTHMSFEGLDVVEWNAEVPTIYNAFITLYKNGAEIMTLRNLTGFRQVEIKGNTFTFNGQKIKIKGVNHHDTNGKTGYVMSFDDYEKDVRLIKEYNGNAVRTSHYPPDPCMIALADTYGLYIIDEADIETHGAALKPYNNIDLISDDPKWAPRYLDRVRRMYFRDRNHPCVTMWSLGNEAGGYACQDACYEFLHDTCPDIPIHYEGVIHTARKAYDVVSDMYPSHEQVERVGCGVQKGNWYREKPYFLCEYVHAMGFGPGAMEEYWESFYKHDNLMGGCIWEWADHAVYHEDSKPYEYTYGGDHGEERHDGNFCVDGLVHTDRTPSSGALEMQAVYRPLRAKYNRDGSFTFTNTNRFRSSGYITIKRSLTLDGVKGEEESFTLDIAPCASKRVNFGLEIPKGCDCRMNFEYLDGDKFIALEQVIIKKERKREILPQGTEFSCTDDGAQIKLSFDGGEAVFDRAGGELASYKLGDKELINQSPAAHKGFVPNIFRAMLDNDRSIIAKWEAAGYDDIKLIPTGTDLEAKKSSAKITAGFNLRSKKGIVAKVKITYTVDAAGCIKVDAAFSPVRQKKAASILPRFGLVLEMPESFENVEYVGYGPSENTVDFREHAAFGTYKDTVDGMDEFYIKPQDYGVRSGVRRLTVTDSDGVGLTVCNPDRELCFTIRHFTQLLMQRSMHRDNLHSEHTTVLNIDGFLRGTGTGSCGPDVLDKYAVDGSKGLAYSFVIIPVK